MRPVPASHALLAVAPVAVLALVTGVLDVLSLTDPCTVWGMGQGGSLSPPTSGPCARGMSGDSRTWAEAAASAFVFRGSLLLGAAMAFFGLHRGEPAFAVGGGVLLLLVALPLLIGSTGGVVLGSGFLVLLAAARVREPAPRPLLPAVLWGLAGAAAFHALVAAGGYATTFLGGGPPGVRGEALAFNAALLVGGFLLVLGCIALRPARRSARQPA